MAKPDKDKDAKAPVAANGADAAAKIQTGGWDDSVKVRFRTFNGPAGVQETLRISMTKEAYADLIGHAKESLDREICGVLLGDLCEDEYGQFLAVESTLRGGAAKAGGTHVTFTQETWNEIHSAKEQRFPKLHIVGWYHSHPGFGVEFSDMDLFIQKNFFGGPSQIAFVSDPLGGQEAIVANAGGQIVPVKRFWVDSRERRCFVAASASDPQSSGIAAGNADGQISKTLDDLRDRVRQLTDAVEQQRSLFYNFLTFVGLLLAFCFILAAGYSIWRSYYRPIEPPEEMETMSMPLMVGDKPTIVTLAVKKWEMTPEVSAQIFQEFERVIDEKRKAEAAATQAAATAAAAKPPASNAAPQTRAAR